MQKTSAKYAFLKSHPSLKGKLLGSIKLILSTNTKYKRGINFNYLTLKVFNKDLFAIS